MSAFRIAAITDEFSPDDLDAALKGMAAVGMSTRRPTLMLGISPTRTASYIEGRDNR